MRLPASLRFLIPVLIGAFLVFQVQPLLARRILAWFGGGSSVWTACLLFFQAALLLGYLYAHLVIRYLKPRTLLVVHGSLLLVSLVFLPLAPAESWKPAPGDDPVLRILLLLTCTAGLPYVLVSSTSPILQALYARSKPGASPWRLFALSNTGSLLGLLSYPVLIEPRLALDGQALWWSGLYVCYAIGTLFALIPGSGGAVESAVEGLEAVAEKPRTLAWIGLPALASVMLLAGTNYLTTNVPPTPFLWILPLTAYLLSFILTFDSDWWYRPWVFAWLLGAALLVLAACVRRAELTFEVWILAPAITLGVFVISMWCHGELVRLRPGPARLTRFYLMIAAGGALGGLLVSVVAPAVLPGSAEFPIGLALVALTALAMNYGKNIVRDAAHALVAAIVISVGFAYVQDFVGNSVTTARSFYGALRVTESREGGSRVRTLVHGLIAHGTQVLEPVSEHMKATSYYAYGSGVWRALERSKGLSGRRVG
ncbi:MAG: hypothetical protein SGI92_11610, partial [Bryobacteraceae bacterium]|nr:hypothetical protein [Bryobacteraceae bacterium]